MTRLRKSILFMIFYLLVVFNVERLGESTIGLHIAHFVYGLVVLAVIATLLIPLLRRHSIYYSLVLWSLIYMLIRLVTIRQQPLFGEFYTYITITEISILAITVILAHELSRALHEMEEIIANVTLPKGWQRVLQMNHAAADIDTEIARCRRYNRPLSLLVVRFPTQTSQVDINRLIKDLQQTMMSRYLSANMAHIISKVARRTDLIIEKDTDNSFVLLCPETNTEGVYILAERLQNIATQRMGIDLRFGTASFPDDALTFEDLLKCADIQAVTPYPIQVQ